MKCWWIFFHKWDEKWRDHGTTYQARNCVKCNRLRIRGSW